MPIRLPAALRGCVAAALFGCSISVAWPAGAQPRPLSIPYQFTHSINDSLAFSPDGKRYVYIVVVAGREQLFTANADGSDPMQITHGDIDHEDPAWSPDGKRIAYVHMQGDAQVIHVMDADGSGDEALTPRDRHVIHPQWHPDGKRLAYCTTDDLDPPRKNASEIQEIDIATRAITVLVTGGINTYPVFSPDGSRLALRKFVDGDVNSEVFVANADGSGLTNISRNPAFDGWPMWSPDGKRIAFGSNRNSSYQIFVMDADGGNVRLVANTDGRATAPQWSRDGKAIYFPLCRNIDYGYDCEIFAAMLDDKGD